MTLDYDSHPSELVEGGEVRGSKKTVTVDDLRRAIPAHCFKRTYSRSLFFLTRDLLTIAGFGCIAWSFIPSIPYRSLRFVAWVLYGYFQGLAFTGLWVEGHECGHGSFSPSNFLNNTIGFLTHSALLTPFFSWQSSHRRHHIYANNLAKDHNYVPPQMEQYAAYLKLDSEHLAKLDEMTEDAPVATFIRIVLQQLLGWPLYLFNNTTASPGSLYGPQSKSLLGNSHVSPRSTLFRPEEAHLILASDIGLLATLSSLYLVAQKFGFGAVFLMYGQPYLWLNHWIVAITYLHHTHPDVPKYGPESWTFLKGALATVDRNLGWVGKHMLHNIADYHTIHHLFSHIPQHRAEEATKAIAPLLGSNYRRDERSFNLGLWEAFTKCQWVAPDDKEGKEKSFWFKAGPMLPPEISMRYRGWLYL